MNAHNLSWVGVFLAAALHADAQLAAKSGFYEISSGDYIECCGIAGENHISLPNSAQRFVKLNVDAQTHIASMAILGEDLQTVFSITPFCPPSQQAISFSFDGGFAFPGHFVFQVDPGPDGLYWNYTLSNSPASLSMNGLVGLAQNNCADAASKFTHTNVVANLVVPPNLELRGYFQDGPLIVVHGRAGWQTVVEASSDLQTWVEIARDVMPANLCLTCPQLDVRDTGATGMTARFYRSSQQP